MVKNKEIIGVYSIINKKNGKKFIGSSINIHQRWEYLINQLEHKGHPNESLQSDWTKYGKENFIFSILTKLKSDSDRIRTEFNCLSKEPLEILYNSVIRNTKSLFEKESDKQFKTDIIPRLEFGRRDCRSFVDCQTVCIPAYDVYENIILNTKKLSMEYFQNKQIIISSVMPDETEYSYLDYLNRLPLQKDYILMTPDCGLYDDLPLDWRDEEIALWHESLHAFKEYLVSNNYNNPTVALLKGSSHQELQSAYEYLRNIFDPGAYMIYLSGDIRSNPRNFDVWTFLQKRLPDFKQPLYIYGFNKKSRINLDKILHTYTINGIISSSFILEARFKGNQKHPYTTRAKKTWENYQRMFL